MRTVTSVLLAIALTATASARDKDKEKYQHPGPIHLTPSGEKWAEKTLRKLTLEEKVGQLFMIWCRASFLNVENPEYLQLREAMQKYHVGSFAMTVHVDGPYLLRSEPYEAAELLNRLQSDSKLPLLFAADFERGVSVRLMGTTVFPHAMAFGADGKLEDAETFGRVTAEESRAIGIHWNFFPVADVNSNPVNPIINTRSFGEDPKQVGDLVAAYIKGAHEGGMLATAKHFPGHGDTSTNSHLGAATVNGDRAHIDSVELAPFRQAIAAGVDSVMVGHLTVPALDSDADHDATISPLIISGLLQQQLGFQGIVVTDALDMAGLTRLFVNNLGRAAVEAFKAGNDLLLLPVDLPSSYNAMIQAVQSGEISREHLDRSVLKILRTKASLGLQEAREVDISTIASVVGKPENLAFGQQVADAAVTLVRDNGKVLPLKSLLKYPSFKYQGTAKAALPYTTQEETHNQTVAVLFSDDVRTESGRAFGRELRARIPDAHVFYVDSRMAAGMSEEVLKAVDEAKTVVAAVYLIPMSGKAGMAFAVADTTGKAGDMASVTDPAAVLLQGILDRAAEKTAVVAMGSPYIAASFPKIENYVCAFSSATVSELSAVKALFGEVAIRGHLPVSIPNVAERGAGIQRAAQVQGGGTEHAQK